MEVLSIDETFKYNKITLGSPTPIQGGAFLSKLTVGNDNPVFIQMPKCTLKQGLISTKKNKYVDLMYDRANSDKLVEWIEIFEQKIQTLVEEKKTLWFQSELTIDDIETMMTPISRSYKSGKKILIRAYIDNDKITRRDKCVVYNEKQEQMSLDNLVEEVELVPLIQIEDIKFSARSFEIDIKVLQVMILDKKPDITEVCLIKTNGENNFERNILAENDYKNSLEKSVSYFLKHSNKNTKFKKRDFITSIKSNKIMLS